MIHQSKTQPGRPGGQPGRPVNHEPRGHSGPARWPCGSDRALVGCSRLPGDPDAQRAASGSAYGGADYGDSADGSADGGTDDSPGSRGADDGQGGSSNSTPAPTAAVAAQAAARPALPAEVSVAEAAAKRDAGAFILDVRTPDEWKDFHVPGSTLIPLDELPNRVAEVPKDKEVVVVCRSGNRSATGRDVLLKAGYPQVDQPGRGSHSLAQRRETGGMRK